MKIFLDTASLKEIKEAAALGVIDGVTTNPTLLSKESGEPEEILVQICETVNGPISAEVVATDAEGMVREGRHWAGVHKNIVVKCPCTTEGLKATKTLSSSGVLINMTLVFSPTQALLAAEAGAHYVSCFMGRLDDISVDSAEVLGGIVGTLRPAPVTSQVLAASIRHPEHVVTAARLGCEVATIPAKVLRQMLGHPLTEKGRELFKADWQSRPEFVNWLRDLVAKQPASA
jgi:transaldolase